MKPLPLRTRLYGYLQRHEGDWIHSGHLEKLAQEAGYKASNGSRRLRELQSEGRIEVKYERGSALYRYVKPAPLVPIKNLTLV